MRAQGRAQERVRRRDRKARAQGLRRLALAQLGSAGAVDEQAFRLRVVEMTIRKAVPVGLRAAARLNSTHADALTFNSYSWVPAQNLSHWSHNATN